MMDQKVSGAHRSSSDRATRPADQAPAGLGDTASVPCAFTGPWFVARDEDDEFSIETSDDTTVCELTFFRRSTSEANARLIAAAPELYEALDEALDALVMAACENPGTGEQAEAQRRLVRAERALAKARGEA